MKTQSLVPISIVLFLASPALAQRGTEAVDRTPFLDPDLQGDRPTWREIETSADSFGLNRGGGTRPAILLTGYWPPTNEMLRRFSPSPTQNPQGWIGDNWENRGYDVYSYFPEFTPPDCDFCGKGDGDLEVDYQDTSLDFWNIANALQPIAVITFSRGFNNKSWELEMNQYNRATWIGDYVSPFQPTPAPPDGDVPAGTLRLSQLPVQEIVDAVNNANLGVNAYICFSGDGGGFLSEFIAYHGVWYQSLHASPADPAWCITGGHVHVGARIDWATAETAAEITLRTVIDHVDDVRGSIVCQTDLGFGGPGVSDFRICGDPLSGGGVADMLLDQAAPSAPAVMLASPTFAPTPFGGGQLVPLPPTLIASFLTDSNGRVFVEGLPGGDGPATVFAQFVYVDPGEPFGVGISNALSIDVLP